MSEKLNFTVLYHKHTNSCFDWVNIDHGKTRVRKARVSILGRSITIFSINIFPDFERKGYAKKTIEMFKKSFDIIIADRVRHTAIGFWTKMGFIHKGEGTYLYHKGGNI